MKLLTRAAALTLAALLAFSAPAFALCDDWSRQDTVLEVAGQALLGVDWAQSRALAVDPKRHDYNATLGRHADAAWVNRYFLEIALAHLAASCVLHPEYRGLFQSFTVGLEANQVWYNHGAGVRITASW